MIEKSLFDQIGCMVALDIFYTHVLAGQPAIASNTESTRHDVLGQSDQEK